MQPWMCRSPTCGDSCAIRASPFLTCSRREAYTRRASARRDQHSLRRDCANAHRSSCPIAISADRRLLRRTDVSARRAGREPARGDWGYSRVSHFPRRRAGLGRGRASRAARRAGQHRGAAQAAASDPHQARSLGRRSSICSSAAPPPTSSGSGWARSSCGRSCTGAHESPASAVCATATARSARRRRGFLSALYFSFGAATLGRARRRGADRRRCGASRSPRRRRPARVRRDRVQAGVAAAGTDRRRDSPHRLRGSARARADRSAPGARRAPGRSRSCAARPSSATGADPRPRRQRVGDVPGRAAHDSRPALPARRSVPEEAVLEGILASLAIVLREAAATMVRCLTRAARI